MRHAQLKPRFVEFVPDTLEEGILYISMEYQTVVHKCCCGCGTEISTPLSPTDWRLIYDGKSITLDPSIGNWSLPCQSHYWIKQNHVRWAGPWNHKRIEAGRTRDKRVKQIYFEDQTQPMPSQDSVGKTQVKQGFFGWLKSLFK